MMIIEKHFESKPTEKELGEFVSNIIFSKGEANMDVIYDEDDNPLYIRCKIYEEKLND